MLLYKFHYLIQTVIDIFYEVRNKLNHVSFNSKCLFIVSDIVFLCCIIFAIS